MKFIYFYLLNIVFFLLILQIHNVFILNFNEIFIFLLFNTCALCEAIKNENIEMVKTLVSQQNINVNIGLVTN